MSDKRIESHRDSRKLPKLVHNTEAKSEGENAQIQESWMKCFCTNKEADLFAHTEYIDTCANICLLAIYGDLFNSTENTIFCIYATYFGTSCRSLMNFHLTSSPELPTISSVLSVVTCPRWILVVCVVLDCSGIDPLRSSFVSALLLYRSSYEVLYEVFWRRENRLLKGGRQPTITAWKRSAY
jgi:hypothetical protein